MWGGGGGGVLGLEKGTDCGPSAAELWLSRANNAKKGGLSSHYRGNVGCIAHMCYITQVSLNACKIV